MQKMNDVLRCLILFVAIGEVLAAFAAEPPLMMIRLRGPHTADDAQWAKTFKALKENFLGTLETVVKCHFGHSSERNMTL